MDSSLTVGASGMQAAQQMLNVVGNNLANLNTTAFKSQQANFSDVLYQTIQGASITAQGDGTNPQQIGSGVSTSLATDESQGTLTTTGNPLDLAIQGNGAFVVNNGNQNYYTRAGSFNVDQQNYLVDPTTGDRVQRFGTVGEGSATAPAFQTAGDSDIKIPYGTGIPAQATATVDLTGNLSASDTGPLAEILTSSTAYTSGGAPATGATLLNSLDGRGGAYQTGDSILITGTDANGSAVSTSVSVNATSTMNTLLSAINSAYTGATASLNAQGNLVLTANNTGPSQLSLTLADGPTNVGSSNFGNYSMATTVTGQDGDKVNTSIQVYDTQGTAHNLSLTFQKQSDNTWNLTAAINPQEGTMLNSTVTGIRFNSNGSFSQAGTFPAAISFQIAGLSSPQTIDLSMGSPQGFGGLTEFGGADSAAATSQDGFAAGFLTSVSVDQNGIINGAFSNGKTLALAQVAMASFSNAAGLTRDGQNYFSPTVASGDARIGAAGSGDLGTIQGGSLEGSNVNVSTEFTNMIVAQQGYELNARTMTVSNEVLQDLTNLIH